MAEQMTGAQMVIQALVDQGVEHIFGYPGVGSLLTESVVKLDYPLMQGLFLIITVVVLVANLLILRLFSNHPFRVRLSRI